MCKHIVNAQVSIRAPCCRRWFDCSDCHSENSDHNIKKHYEMVFACKKCKKVFRKDTREFDETDEFCPHCDNHFVLPANESMKSRGSNKNKLNKKDEELEKTEDIRTNSSILLDTRMQNPLSLEEQLKDFDYSTLLED